MSPYAHSFSFGPKIARNQKIIVNWIKNGKLLLAFQNHSSYDFFFFLNIEIFECIICDSGVLGDGSPDSIVATVAATFILSVVDFLNFVV